MNESGVLAPFFFGGGGVGRCTAVVCLARICGLKKLRVFLKKILCVREFCVTLHRKSPEGEGHRMQS